MRLNKANCKNTDEFPRRLYGGKGGGGKRAFAVQSVDSAKKQLAGSGGICKKQTRRFRDGVVKVGAAAPCPGRGGSMASKKGGKKRAFAVC